MPFILPKTTETPDSVDIICLDRRQSQIEKRLDRRWQPYREHPVLESGNICYEVSGRIEATNCGGLGMIQEVVKAVDLREIIDENVSLLKRHLPYHESDHILALAYNLLSGGLCLEDLEARRHDSAFLDALGARRIPDPTTAGDFLRRFAATDVTQLMEAINIARTNVWRAQPKKERRLALIDVDGTLVDTLGECKEGMDISYKGRWGFGPLLVSLANSQEPLFLVNRPANRPSHDGAAPWLDKAVEWARQGAGFERVRLRGDTDFSLTTNFDRWTEDAVEFVFGIDAHPSFVRRAQELADAQWAPMDRPVREPKRRRPKKVKRAVIQERGFRQLTLEKEHVAEMSYKPSKAKKTYRMIVLRKQIRVTEGQLRLEDEVRYFFYVTNIPADQMDPAAVVRENNARCNQENLIEQLKNGGASDPDAGPAIRCELGVSGNRRSGVESQSLVGTAASTVDGRKKDLENGVSAFPERSDVGAGTDPKSRPATGLSLAGCQPMDGTLTPRHTTLETTMFHLASSPELLTFDWLDGRGVSALRVDGQNRCFPRRRAARIASRQPCWVST